MLSMNLRIVIPTLWKVVIADLADLADLADIAKILLYYI